MIIEYVFINIMYYVLPNLFILLFIYFVNNLNKEVCLIKGNYILKKRIMRILDLILCL